MVLPPILVKTDIKLNTWQGILKMTNVARHPIVQRHATLDELVVSARHFHLVGSFISAQFCISMQIVTRPVPMVQIKTICH
jgi:hypothetical protein